MDSDTASDINGLRADPFGPFCLRGVPHVRMAASSERPSDDRLCVCLADRRSHKPQSRKKPQKSGSTKLTCYKAAATLVGIRGGEFIAGRTSTGLESPFRDYATL